MELGFSMKDMKDCSLVMVMGRCSLTPMSCHVEEGRLQEDRRFACRPVQELEQVGIVPVLEESR